MIKIYFYYSISYKRNSMSSLIRFMTFQPLQNFIAGLMKEKIKDLKFQVWPIFVDVTNLKPRFFVYGHAVIFAPWICKWFQLGINTNFQGRGFGRLARWFGPLAGPIAAWQILTPRDTFTLVRDQMILPPVTFRRLTLLTYLIYENLLIFYEIIIV